MNQQYQTNPGQGQSFFDGNDVDESLADGFEPLPNGDYPAVVLNCEIKASNKNPEVLMYSIEMEIFQGEFMGRKYFANFVFKHSNPKAANIGKARMKQLCISILGVGGVNAPDQLYSKPFTLRLKRKTDKQGVVNNELVKTGPASGIVDGNQQVAQPTNVNSGTQQPGNNNQNAAPGSNQATDSNIPF